MVANRSAVISACFSSSIAHGPPISAIGAPPPIASAPIRTTAVVGWPLMSRPDALARFQLVRLGFDGRRFAAPRTPREPRCGTEGLGSAGPRQYPFGFEGLGSAVKRPHLALPCSRAAR